MRFRHAFTVPKDPRLPNEDRWAVSEDGRICALSDGASVSFDSATWATLLTEQFVSRPRVDRSWLCMAADKHNCRFDHQSLPWMMQAALERGSFATLVGVNIAEYNALVTLFAVGDSVAILLSEDKIVTIVPDIGPSLEVPTLLPTSPRDIAALDERLFSDNLRAQALADCTEPAIVLATDALAAWLCELDTSERIAKLLALEDEAAFVSLVHEERAAKRMRRDDTTMLLLR